MTPRRPHEQPAPGAVHAVKRPAPHEITGPGGVLRVRPDDAAAIDLAMLIEGETSGRALDEVLARYGRSRSTYYEKLRRFQEHGLEGLLARPSGPRSPWRRPVEILRFVVSRRIRFPDHSAADIAAELERMGHRISVRSVERTLSQFGLTRATPRGQAAPAPQPVPADSPRRDGEVG